MVIIWKVSSRNVEKQILAGKENLNKRIEVDLTKETLNLKWSKYFEMFTNLSIKLEKWLNNINVFLQGDEQLNKTQWYLPDEIKDLLSECRDFSMKYNGNPVLKTDFDDLSAREQEARCNLEKEQRSIKSKLEDAFKRYLDKIHEN